MFVVNFRFVIVIITYDLFISLVTISISTFSGLKRPFRNTLLGAPRIETIKPDFRLVYCTTACTNISVQQLLISLIDHCSPSFVKRLSRHRIHSRWSWSNRFCFELVKFSVIFDKKKLFTFGKSDFSKIQVFHLLLDRYQRLGWTRYFHQAVFCLSCLFCVLCKIEHKL